LKITLSTFQVVHEIQEAVSESDGESEPQRRGTEEACRNTGGSSAEG